MDLAKYTIIKGSDEVPLPSHFSTASFTIAAFDNFDYHDKTVYQVQNTLMTQHQSCVNRDAP